MVRWKFSSGELETPYCGTLSIAVEYFILTIAKLVVEILFTFQSLRETIFPADVADECCLYARVDILLR